MFSLHNDSWSFLSLVFIFFSKDELTFSSCYLREKFSLSHKEWLFFLSPSLHVHMYTDTHTSVVSQYVLSKV